MTRNRLRAPLLALLGALSVAAPAGAQRDGYSYLSYAGPDVSLVSKDEDDTTARVNMPIVAGDRLSTSRSSRAEAILSDGTVVRFDARTDARFDRLARTYQSDDDRTLIALQSGSLALETRRAAEEGQAIRIDTEDATVVVAVRALVRVDAGRRGTEVYVASGSAEVMGRSGRATVRAGESASVSGSDPVEVAESDLPRDGFTQFVDERRARRGGESLQYLEKARLADQAEGSWDQEDAGYAASQLDEYGSWVNASGGSDWCWRPRVAADWSPYSAGYWRYTPCGLTWVAYEPWGWMPFHYGSWFLDAAFGWCWSPGWAYSPAWVYWNYTPGWVGWCPMGFYGGHGGGHGHGGHDGGPGSGGRDGGRFENGYAHLSGRVDVSRIDGRGWNFVSAGRVGGRIERGEIVRGDRVAFRPGETGTIATAPLRVERTLGVPARTAVQEAVRRVSTEANASGRGADPALTSILRHERNLSPAARETLRRSFVTTGRDTAYRALPAEQIASGRVESGARWRDTSVRTEATTGRGGTGAVAGESWRRDAHGEVRGPRGEETGRPAARGDEGWRSTNRGGSDRFRRDDSGWRPSGQRAEGSRSEGSPGGRADVSGDRSGRSRERTADAPRTTQQPRREDSGWRAPAPRSAEPPRSIQAPRHEMRAYEAPRSYEPARPAPAPRSYETPRSYQAPRAPAPAPRFEAPRAPAPAPAPRVSGTDRRR